MDFAPRPLWAEVIARWRCADHASLHGAEGRMLLKVWQLCNVFAMSVKRRFALLFQSGGALAVRPGLGSVKEGSGKAQERH